MVAYDINGSSARVRWLLAGTFSSQPDGRCHRVARDSLAALMADIDLRFAVDVRDQLALEATRRFDVRFEHVRDFKVENIVAMDPTLEGLRQLADDLGSSRTDVRPSLDVVIERAEALVGPGQIVDALRQLEPAERADTVPAKVSIDEIVTAEPQGNTRKTAASAVDAFVKQMRGSPGGRTAFKIPTTLARKARAIIETALYGTVEEILRTPSIARAHSLWRGIKLVLDHCPADGAVEILLLDTSIDAMPQVLEDVLPADPVEWPDCFFVVDPVDCLEKLSELSTTAEGLNAPLVVTVGEALLGEATIADPASVLPSTLRSQWDAFRAREATRWLSVCINPVVLSAESGTETSQRVSFAAPPVAAAAHLAATYRDTGAFGRVLGKDGGIAAPATYLTDDGSGRECMVPVQIFMPVRHQAALATQGLTAFGSSRNSDKVVLSRWPTMYAGEDAAPLPGQIVTGRIVRFAQWARDQLPPNASDEDIAAAFEQGASVFLFGGIPAGAQIQAKRIEIDGEGPHIAVSARVHAALASIPIELEFALPVKG